MARKVSNYYLEISHHYQKIKNKQTKNIAVMRQYYGKRGKYGAVSAEYRVSYDLTPVGGALCSLPLIHVVSYIVVSSLSKRLINTYIRNAIGPIILKLI